jgi:HJR/Mrr/RecB family endonuclease
VAAIAFAVYAGGGLALPLVRHWSPLDLIAVNFLATMLSGVFVLAWLGVQLRARDRRHLLDWTTNLRLLSAEEFEWFVAELFRRGGWEVRETGKHGEPDGNIDLMLTRGTERRFVQCKRWVSWLVGVDDIRRFGGTLMREGLPGIAGVFVTLSSFTSHAQTEAAKIGMALIDGRELLERAQKVRRAEPCPVCKRPMLLDHSPRGWWFRCVWSRCGGKRDLANEPGAAIDLLTASPVP